MKIMFFSSFYFPNEYGGTEVCLRILANELVRMGHDVAVVALGLKFDETIVEGVKVSRVPIANLYLPFSDNKRHSTFSKLLWHCFDTWNPVACHRVKNIIETIQPDVIHTHGLVGFSCALWKFLKEKSIPIVHTLHDFYLNCPRGRHKDNHYCERQCTICSLFSLPKRFMCRNVNHVIGVSQFLLDQHLQNGYFDSDRSSVIYNPIFNKHTVLPDVEFSPESGNLRLGFIGRLDPQKGVEILLDTCDLIMPYFSSIDLYIAGEGESGYEKILRSKAKSCCANAIFMGKVSPDVFYRQVHLVVVPSQWREPLGRIPMEAFSFGLPVVSTPSGGLPETTRGAAGVVAASGDAWALAKAIREAVQRLVENPEGVRSSALVEAKKYLPSEIACQHLKLYESISNGINIS
jgi:glycosyltransferase involved in cell wall biosynthesis